MTDISTNCFRFSAQVLRLLRNPDPTLLPTDLRRETENASDQRSSIEARPQHMPDDIGAREGVVCFENEEIAVLDEEQWMGVATENQPKTEDTTRAGETRNRDRGVYSQRRRTVAREEYGGVRGNDIRQKQRSAQVGTPIVWFCCRFADIYFWYYYGASPAYASPTIKYTHTAGPTD